MSNFFANNALDGTEEGSTYSERSRSRSNSSSSSPDKEVEVIEEIFTQKASLRRLEDAMTQKEEGNNFFRDKNFECAVFF
jgi:ubiquinone biosynthesis protein Coq4